MIFPGFPIRLLFPLSLMSAVLPTYRHFLISGQSPCPWSFILKVKSLSFASHSYANLQCHFDFLFCSSQTLAPPSWNPNGGSGLRCVKLYKQTLRLYYFFAPLFIYTLFCFLCELIICDLDFFFLICCCSLDVETKTPTNKSYKQPILLGFFMHINDFWCV